jgi:RNA polymerase sigma-70 factor, ECF subfamily
MRTTAIGNSDVKRQREVVEAFLAATREGDFEALLAVLDPNVVRRADAAAVPPGAPRELRGAEAVAKGALALIDGNAGVVVAPRGRLRMAVAFGIRGGKIATLDIIADRERLARLHLAVLEP